MEAAALSREWRPKEDKQLFYLPKITWCTLCSKLVFTLESSYSSYTVIIWRTHWNYETNGCLITCLNGINGVCLWSGISCVRRLVYWRRCGEGFWWWRDHGICRQSKFTHLSLHRYKSSFFSRQFSKLISIQKNLATLTCVGSCWTPTAGGWARRDSGWAAGWETKAQQS